ncbi:MAG: B12-binding domain-containing radical SAM protein, partial [Candidatus Omnitrophica bacterium]|nr:B12-binding domain-containing radical SAM protein [Candidatus Omnitrophota bacterium]
MYDDLLLEVRRPAQYLGGEWNVSNKDFDNASIKFALSFPDLYEIGMSNLGLRIIYGLLNSFPDVVCERFFAVDSDLERLLRLQKREILSLESRKRLIEFDLAGFSLGSELGYTNVLNILDLANFPLKASLRDHTYPLVIGGGPCVLNPEPMHDFFDFFVIGEAEDLIREVLDTYRKYKKAYKSGRMEKTELLSVLSNLEGVYVSCLYEVIYSTEGKIKEFRAKRKDAPLKIKKRFVKDLDS